MQQICRILKSLNKRSIMTLAEFEKTLARLKKRDLSPDTEIRLGIYGGGSSQADGLYLDDNNTLIIH